MGLFSSLSFTHLYGQKLWNVLYSVDTFGDIKILQDAIGSSWKYAQNILLAIKQNTTEDLFHRATRHDCIKQTDFPELLSQWAKAPDNSRPVPGNETVSVSYGRRLPKFVLLKPREMVIAEFLEAHPQCPFSRSTLNREWPQQIKSATSRDLDRNVCTIHSNMRRMQRALAKHLGPDLPTSCRLLCGLVMCDRDDIDILKPATWHRECVTRSCRECPVHETFVPAELRDVQVTVALWGNRKDPIKNKMINNIHDFTFTLEELAAKFDKDVVKMCLHLNTASLQWDSCRACTDNTAPNVVVTIEDYQVFVKLFVSQNYVSILLLAAKSRHTASRRVNYSALHSQ